MKRELEQAKLENGEALEKVKEWGKETEKQIDDVDNEVKLLEGRAKELMVEAKTKDREIKESPLPGPPARRATKIRKEANGTEGRVFEAAKHHASVDIE